MIIVTLSGMFRIPFLSSWCWMSPYSDSHFDLLTYAKQKQPPGDKSNTEISCHSSLKDNEQFQCTMKGHYIVLFAYSHIQTPISLTLGQNVNSVQTHLHNIAHVHLFMHSHCMISPNWQKFRAGELRVRSRQQLQCGDRQARAHTHTHWVRDCSGKNASVVLVCWAVTF